MANHQVTLSPYDKLTIETAAGIRIVVSMRTNEDYGRRVWVNVNASDRTGEFAGPVSMNLESTRGPDGSGFVLLVADELPLED